MSGVKPMSRLSRMAVLPLFCRIIVLGLARSLPCTLRTGPDGLVSRCGYLGRAGLTFWQAMAVFTEQTLVC